MGHGERRRSATSWQRAGLGVVALLLAACGGATAGESGTPGGGGGGGASSGGSANGGGNSAGSGGSSGKPLCDDYCDTVMAACTGNYAEYASRELCLAVCAALPPGSEGDGEVNSVQCRLRQARVVAAGMRAPDVCSSAGPGGAGVCGTNCESLCVLAEAACPNGALGSASMSNCRDACAPLPDNGAYFVTQQTGYTVQCRLYHVTAASLDPAIHCPHVDGTGPCAAMAHN